MTKAQETYERVEALVAKGTTRPDAFRTVAAENDQSVDSVRGSYYSGRRQATGSSGTARGGRRKRQTETTAESAIASAIQALEQSIRDIQQEVDLAGDRAAEAKREHDALAEAALPKIEAIQAKIAALQEGQA